MENGTRSRIGRRDIRRLVLCDDAVYRVAMSGNRELASLLLRTYMGVESEVEEVQTQRHMAIDASREVIYDTYVRCADGSIYVIEVQLCGRFRRDRIMAYAMPLYREASKKAWGCGAIPQFGILILTAGDNEGWGEAQYDYRLTVGSGGRGEGICLMARAVSLRGQTERKRKSLAEDLLCCNLGNISNRIVRDALRSFRAAYGGKSMGKRLEAQEPFYYQILEERMMARDEGRAEQRLEDAKRLKGLGCLTDQQILEVTGIDVRSLG